MTCQPGFASSRACTIASATLARRPVSRLLNTPRVIPTYLRRTLLWVPPCGRRSPSMSVNNLYRNARLFPMKDRGVMPIVSGGLRSHMFLPRRSRPAHQIPSQQPKAPSADSGASRPNTPAVLPTLRLEWPEVSNGATGETATPLRCSRHEGVPFSATGDDSFASKRHCRYVTKRWGRSDAAFTAPSIATNQIRRFRCSGGLGVSTAVAGSRRRTSWDVMSGTFTTVGGAGPGVRAGQAIRAGGTGRS